MRRRLLISAAATCLAASLRLTSAVTIAAMGDSITAGKDDSGDQSQSWPAQLDTMLGDAVTVRNFGRSGRTVQDNEDAYILTKFWTSALNSGADIGIIALGTNDAKDEHWQGTDPFASAYRNIIETALATFKVVCLSVPIPQLSDSGHWSNRSIINKVLPPAVYSLAQEYSLPLVDARSYYYLHAHSTLNASLYEDPIHPNAIGYRYIAKATKDVLDPIINISVDPSAIPMPHPLSFAPTFIPTNAWTAIPSMAPMPMPHIAPTAMPQAAPTLTPEVAPTAIPSTDPTSISHAQMPEAAPTALPIHAPTQMPQTMTMAPVGVPSTIPLPAPSAIPSDAPQSTPTAVPVVVPTVTPLAAPTAIPTHFPSTAPEVAPIAISLHLPTAQPKPALTPMPIQALTAIPKAAPTAMPHHALIPNPGGGLSTAMPGRAPTAPPQATPTMMPGALPTGTSRQDGTSKASNRQASSSKVSLETLVFVALGGAVVALLIGGAYWYFAHCSQSTHLNATPSMKNKARREIKKVGPLGQESPTSGNSVSPDSSCASRSKPFFNYAKPIALSAPNLGQDSSVLHFPNSILRDAKSLSIPRRTSRNYSATKGFEFKRSISRASFRSTTSLSLDSEGSVVRVDAFHTPRSSNFVISSSSPMHSATGHRRAPPAL